MEKKQFLWDFCLASSANSELLATKRDEKHQKVFFYTNLVPKARLMENLGLTQHFLLETQRLKMREMQLMSDSKNACAAKIFRSNCQIT